jgi:hypothetical protein
LHCSGGEERKRVLTQRSAEVSAKERGEERREEKKEEGFVRDYSSRRQKDKNGYSFPSYLFYL